MLQRVRKGVAATLTVALLLGPVATATADDEGLAATQRRTPVVLDALILRPLGLVLTAIGTVLFVPAAGIVMVTRPVDVGKPFQTLVANPFRYVFLDPLGEH